MLQIHKTTLGTGFNPAGERILAYMGYIGMCSSKEYDFLAVLVFKRYKFLIIRSKLGYFFCCGLASGISFTRYSIQFCINIGIFVALLKC